MGCGHSASDSFEIFEPSWLISSSAHGIRDCTDPRSRLEVEAESVAFGVAMATGLDTSSYSLPYLAGWAEPGKEAEVMADSAGRVIATARRILAGQEAFEPAIVQAQ
jgi:hypothetical protein